MSDRPIHTPGIRIHFHHDDLVELLGSCSFHFKFIMGSLPEGGTMTRGEYCPPPRLWDCTWGVEVDGQQKAPARAWEAGQGLIDRKNGGNLLSRKLYMHYHRQCGV